MRSLDDPELMDVARRFVMPGRRYMKLNGGVLRRSGTDRELFMRELVQAAREITPTELHVLLDGEWRARRVACWLIAVAGRTEFRGRLGESLMASEGAYHGSPSLALATFGTDADVDLLCAYLDRYLPRTDIIWDQTGVLSTLLHLDAVLVTERAALYLAPGGLWEHWTAGTSNTVRDPREYQATVAGLCAFTRDCAELFNEAEAEAGS
ncbi:DUF6000 family protein [Streptomyces sp. NPDC097619]|uniref:DUF6000 family protein n=1 Tax=Streptomyces sp. NPDC097619 TaxID=3157228 RepID=UPI00332F24A6